MQLYWLAGIFGGYNKARIWHFWLMWVFILFVVPHVTLVLADGWDTLRSMIDSPNVQLMADVFHMNIEEDSIAASLRAHAAHIAHVHLADNQRREPGSGHLDFASVFQALADNAYTGALAMEFLPATDGAIRAGREWVQDRL